MIKSIDDRQAALRTLMAEKGIDIYIVPTSDDHSSEYVGDYFKTREYITGFTGSAGTAIITPTESGLWTDGRYFVQAEKQLADNQTILYKMGNDGVLTVSQYIQNQLEILAENGKQPVIGFDGRCMTAVNGYRYLEMVNKFGGELKTDLDLVGELWNERPGLVNSKPWILTEEYSGVDTAQKLSDVRSFMKNVDAKYHLISDLCNVAWLLNMRGEDISHVPVFMSYMLISQDEATLFIGEDEENWNDSLGVTDDENAVDLASGCNRLTSEVKKYLSERNISIKPYNDIYQTLEIIDGSILLDERFSNYEICSSLSEEVNILNQPEPETLMRAVKNDVEISNTIAAHIDDGVAMTKFIYQVKKKMGLLSEDVENVGKLKGSEDYQEMVDEEPLTELSAATYLDKLRSEIDDYLDLSFSTISAYGPNAAMAHYSATPENYSVVDPRGFLLVDSGGHYKRGTTDITRTTAVGPVSDEEREMYTRTLQSHLRLEYAKFIQGTAAVQLDILAREPYWEVGKDFKHGTGHGVGHILNVHEGPNSFRWRITDLSSVQEMLPGMITSDEPGYYEDDKYGIRIENEILCQEDMKNDYGQFFSFKPLTMVPIDLEPVDLDMLSNQEKSWINDYHRQVRENIAPHLTGATLAWLEEVTQPV